MRVTRLANWLRRTRRPVSDAPAALRGGLRAAAGCLLAAGLLFAPSWAETDTLSSADGQAILVGASLQTSPTLPFSSEAELLNQLGQDFAPVQELFLNIALAQVCGLRTKQVEAEYLARRAQLAQREDLDFDTLKALRYLSYVRLERRLRSVEPARLRPWCDEQSADLQAFFQPQL